MMKGTDKPSALPRRKFSRICGEKTTTQQAMEMELCACHVSGVAYFDGLRDGPRELTHPQIPDMASTSRLRGPVGGAMMVDEIVI
jgi:hypothetical protein